MTEHSRTECSVSRHEKRTQAGRVRQDPDENPSRYCRLRSCFFLSRRATMKALCIIVVSGCVALLALSVTAIQTQKKQAPTKGIDAETVAAYKQLGAKYGYGSKTGLSFRVGQKNAEEAGLPGVQFKNFPKARLPNVAVPFGLDLAYSDVTDTGLKELAPLTNLTVLNLCATKVTDAGLKELAPLKNITVLNLHGTKV